jgi:DNA-binding response OmpR family regulator
MSRGVDSEEKSSKGHVLLVEGQPEVALIIELALEDEGYRVTCTDDERQVVEIALSEHPSVVVLNLMLSDGQGWQVLRDLKATPETRRIPIIVTSAPTDHVHEGESYLAEIVLEQPCDLGDLIGAVTRALSHLSMNR